MVLMQSSCVTIGRHASLGFRHAYLRGDDQQAVAEWHYVV